MTARTVSELASWDRRLDQQRQNSKWRRSSSTLARDPYHTPVESQSIEIFQSSSRVSDQKRVEKSASRSNRERGSFENSPEKLPSHVDTISTPFRDAHRYHSFISHNVPSPTFSPSPLTALPKSSHRTPNLSTLPSRAYHSRPSSSREHVASSQPALTAESEVIDLTLDDTDGEQSVGELLAPNSMDLTDPHADPGSERWPSLFRHSSPLAPDQSLFTPPPRRPRRLTRLLIDYVAAPAFPKGLTKADYQPIFGHSAVQLPTSTGASLLEQSSPARVSATREGTPSLQKGKEQDYDVVSSPGMYSHWESLNEADVAPNACLDALFEYTMIPLQDDDTYPPLTTLDLVINSRFQFAHWWRGHASRLRDTELSWTIDLGLLGKACIWARSMGASSPRIPGTTGYVTMEQLRSWELAPPHDTSQNPSDHLLDEDADATGVQSAVGADGDHLLSPNDTLSVPTVAFDPACSSSPLSQSFSSTAVDMEHDMNQYFNGLSDSPNKLVPREQPAPTHTFRPHLLRPAGHAQMSPLGLGFPTSELDPRSPDTGSHGCFLGVPPSPTPARIGPSIAPVLTPSSPFPPVNNLSASLNNVLSGDVPLTDGWSLEQGEGLPPDNNPPPHDCVPPTAPSTIDPSLLGPEQHQTLSRPSRDAPLKRRSKLPEPVVYIRRPIDSSRLPMMSGKRAVQIKYRDPEGSPATPSTQSVSHHTSSNPVEHITEPSTNAANDSPRLKRPSAPSRKLREQHAASDPDSDFVPEASSSKVRKKPKQPSTQGKKSATERHSTDATTEPTMSFCHQCRNRTNRPKMLCSNVIGDRVCGKRFCNRCILYRYPDVTFDEHSASFLCPVCTNTCNCSACSRNRGEEFISMRLGGLAASIFKTKVTLVRDVTKPHPRPDSPRKDGDVRRSASEAAPSISTPVDGPGAPPGQTHFWAHVYGIEGDRMGSAFLTREHMNRLQAPGPSPPPPLSKPARRKPRRRQKEREKATRGPRVFIGRPLESWNVRAVRDLEPSVDVETRRGERMDKGGDSQVAPVSGPSRRGRCYVGQAGPLREPYGRMVVPRPESPALPSSRCSTPVLDSDGSLSPLSELEATDDWPQPEVGECCSWEPPPPPPPPGATVHGTSLGPSGLGIPDGVVSAKTDGVERQDVILGSGLDMDVAMDVDMNANVDGNGNGNVAMHGDKRGPGPGSMALSNEDLARAISAALAAISVQLPA